MYHQTPPGGSKKCSSSSSTSTNRQHRPGGVDQQVVKLLADVGYIADRLRNLERCWELAELKDLHKRIVVLLASDECPPVNVLRAIRNDQLRPLQAELHGRTQLQQEVEQAAVEARQADKVKRARWRQEVDCLNADDETAQAKLAQLEDFVVAFYRSYRDTRQSNRVRGGNCSRKSAKKVRERKVFPFLPSSSSDSSPSPTQESSSSSPANTATNKCHQQQQNKPNQTDDAEQQQSFSTSQADRTMNQDREDGDPNVASEQQQAKQPDASTNPSDDTNPSDAKQPEPTTSSSSSNNANNTSTTKDDDEDEDVTTTNTATTTTASEQLVTVVPTVANATPDEKRPSLDGPNSSPLTSPAKSRHVAPSGDSTEPDEEEDDDDDDGGGDCDDDGANGLGGEVAERNKLRKRISELANNFASAKQFQQMCDNIDAINDAELRALIRELKRKIEFAERMNWMSCFTRFPGLSSRPRGPPHRKTSLPKHTDVKKRFLEVAATTLPDEVKAALRLPAFDSYEWEDWDVIHLMQTMFVELNLLDKFQIPPETLREWLYEVYKHYNDVPFHNYRHCFCVAQMMYAITWHTNLIQRLGELEVLILLVSCICHDLDHPGYNNIYQINARTELALRYNDISPLENHHCSIAFRLLEHPECNIFRNMDKELYKDVREGIIRCILATDMARHNEILTQFQEATPIFDYNNKVHTNLLCMVLIKVADISNEARPMDVAEPWLDRLLQEFFAQSAAEKSEGLPVTPFMDPDKVSKPGSQVRFIGLVLLPLFEALGELLPELTDLIIMPVRVALDYYKKLNDAASRQRRSIAEAEQSSENASTATTGTTGTGTAGGSSGGGGGVSSSIGGGTAGGLSNSSTGSPQLPRSQSGISVKSRPELHDLPEGSESGDSETATEVDVAEKTSKFKVDTESSHRKQSHPNSQSSRKGSREKRPSMIGEYYQTGTRIRGSHGNIQHTNRTYFGSNRAISLDQYSNSRRMSDGIQIQTVVSDNSVYYHQRQHRSLEHDSMCSSSDKSTSLNSSSNDPPGQSQPAAAAAAAFQSSHHGTQQQPHFHHQYQQQAAAALHQLRAVQDCENMNIGVPTAAASSGKLYAGLNNNNNSSNNNNKNIGKKMSLSQQQKLEKIRNASNNNNSGGGCDTSGVGVGTSGALGKSNGGGGGGSAVNGTNGTTTTSASKSIISRLRQLTGRLSFNFDSRESKKLQLLAQKASEQAAADGGESQPERVGCATTTTKKTRLLEKSKTVDVGGGGGGSVAICGGASGEGSMHYCCGGGSGGVILNQPKSISPILMHHRNSDVIASMNTARNRAYSLDVPITRNCCRSLSGSTAGGGGSSCGGSHKSLTFSLNKSLNEEANDTTISSGRPLDDSTNATTTIAKGGGSISETI
ncbi:high affinity cGMP-specific 3',5'-cyclic phosphodiesterase 9A isoform X2 [Culex quinquefasciatus]|uniref:high affinity cGMP-specific 3',5'-cyclic phosphodiesterase 9A isoform X2 n=1 Tax=Culex quinquefasciatus TaxID=7176 RepID=UPI0018E3C722|nr:high affinity cGMP-specific 3',5'-cyclic phosphodiesterase 9A isoform X2 [Culex quinquefasciatus]